MLSLLQGQSGMWSKTLASLSLLMLLAPATANAQSELPRPSRESALIQRMQKDMQLGYRYLTIKEYSQAAGTIPTGTKLAIPALIQATNLLSDLTEMYRANIVIGGTSREGRQKFLECLKAKTKLSRWPCPTIILGVATTCERTTFGIEDGSVPCIAVNDAWSLYDISDRWTGNEVWRLSPVEKLIADLRRSSR
jgi:hypothetical protein